MAPQQILSIDDSKAVHAFIERSLEGSDYQAIHAMTAREGFELLKTQGAKIAAVLLDWEMPEINGPDAFVAIKKSHPELPIIMVTSKSDPAEIKRMLAVGAVEYIMKPFTPDILIGRLNAVLG